MRSMLPVSESKTQATLYETYFKVLVDYSLAIFLFVFTLPVMLIIYTAISWTSKGSPIFRQTRVGKNGVEFKIYKFRTMYAEVPTEGRSPTTDSDPRVTPVGRLLRKTSLDELPQLINILKGDMSFIGPRPEQKSIVDTYYTDFERQRFSVKPGLTGLWQISEDRTQPIHHNLHHDFEYINQLSVSMDLSIVYRTFKIMIKSNTH